jgi:hypothetical protein
LTLDVMSGMMSNMVSHKIVAPPKRARQVGVRLTEEDAALLARAAKRARVGISTYCRLVLEAHAREVR